MEFSTASQQERQKIQNLANALSKKPVDRPAKIELYMDGEVITAEIVKRYDEGIIKYFLLNPSGTVKAGYVQALWEKELYKWTWGSRELNIQP